jgi:hypothetical protein
LDPDSNDKDEGDLHDSKDFSPRHSTEAGRQIDCNDEQPQNVAASISASFDPDSNVNDESSVNFEKGTYQRDSTDAGRQIDCNDEQS